MHITEISFKCPTTGETVTVNTRDSLYTTGESATEYHDGDIAFYVDCPSCKADHQIK